MKRLTIIFAGMVAASTPAALLAEITESDASGFTAHGTADVQTSPEETWALLVQPALYWNGEHSWSGEAGNMSLSPVAGGCFCETIPGIPERPSGSVEHMRVVMAMPYRQLTMRGSLGPLQSEALTGTLTVSLEENYGGARITWDYVVGGHARFDLGELALAVDGVIAEQMNSLADRLGRMATE